ncbi:MAG: acetyl-CoA carboxylase biotin carboxyl carrier protein [Planctomycetota bacterium]
MANKANPKIVPQTGIVREVAPLVELMNANQLTEVEVESGDLKIRLKKGVDAPAYTVMAAPAAAPVHAPAAAPAAPIVPADDSDKYKKIVSPMVGTFYRCPRPDAPPFVDVGKVINKETVVCIIEAMKVMNEIKAEMSGKIHKVLVENGQPVEFGQALFLVEPM